MGWEYRKKDQHVCKKPVWARDIAVGDIWKCDECNLRYRVTNVKPGDYDQREGGYYAGVVSWEYYPAGYKPTGITSWRDQ